MLPVIFGLSGLDLTPGERALFCAADPAGYILFARNCRDRVQLRALTDSLRDMAGRNLPILIDQEGGRVARLQPPEWPVFPPPAAFAALYRVAPISAMEAARVNGLALAAVLREVGINVNCLPLLDIPQADADPIIGDRALGQEPMQVAALGRALLDGMATGGVAGVVKHLPGHGRATADSHKALPIVTAGREELESDFAPFAKLRAAAIGMTAHIVYTALDPGRCASLSPRIIADTIRGDIGFDGLLLSDDIGMDALTGSPAARACAVVEAGCDLALHCSGDLAEMEAIGAALPPLDAAAGERLHRALPAAAPDPTTYAELAAKRDALLAYA
jgi:beta-N-acetylhexosaminidase